MPAETNDPFARAVSLQNPEHQLTEVRDAAPARSCNLLGSSVFGRDKGTRMVTTMARCLRSRFGKATAAAAGLLAIGLCAHAADAPTAAPGPTEKPITITVEVSASVLPAVFHAGGQTHLAYELRVTNVGPWNCVITGLDVVAMGDSRPLASFTQADIERMTQRPVTPPSRLEPESSVILYLWVTLDGQHDVPARLRHRLRVALGDYAEVLTLNTPELPVAAEPIVIGAPLKGDRWLAANGPSNTSGHRRARIPIDGHAAIAQRFAIDWVRLDKDGQSFRGDPLKNESYYAYGAEALAVADGVVAAVHDGVPQNVPGTDSRAVPITLETVAGNYVILDLGQGRYAFYAHLQPGSLRVKPRDKVRRGQVVGLVGNTGNSTEPHLHFHLADGPSPLGAEGVPYGLESFDVYARDGAGPADIDVGPSKRARAIPAENELVRFDE